MNKKVVVQASGGVESTTLLAKAINELGKENVYPIVFKSNSVFWQNRDSTAVKRVLTNLQLQTNAWYCDIPDADFLEYHRDDMFEDVGFIPGYKLIMNINALSYAQRVGATEVWIGNMADNVYPDETPQFIQDLVGLYNRTYTQAGSCQTDPITIQSQFDGMSKSDVVRIGYELLGDYIFDTLSCGDERVAGGLNCGACVWCEKRHRGFIEALKFDYTPYLFYKPNDAVLRSALWPKVWGSIQDAIAIHNRIKRKNRG